jgi:serine/threonine-protein kinase ULK4
MNQTEVRKNKSAMTPCYTAPELFSEDGAYNFKTDLWALGCIMYELAVGQVPFFDESVGRLMTKIINEEVNFNRKELQNFSDDFVDVLRRLLDKDPNTRISWGELERHSFWELNVPLFDNKENSLKSEVDGSDPYSQQSSRSQSAKNRMGKNNSFGNINAFDVGSNCQTQPNSTPSPQTSNKKKNADILRLSRNALQNMMEEREDEYALRDKPTEVDNADQEFKFDGKDGNKQEDYDSAERNDYGATVTANDNMPNFEKFIKLKNPLEVSVLNVSHVIKRDKRKTHYNNDELDKSIFKESEIPSIENLMFHQSDKIIKPIIGNKIIEIIPLTTFNKTKLPFQPWKIDKIKEICRSSNIKLMENYLLVIYSLMDQYYNKGDDENLLNLLNYFETIIQDKEIANNIINTSFITIFITFLAKNKSEALKTRVCCIIAYLIRYATVIENPLDELGLCKVLDSLVKEKNVELGRKAIATLGEYLFFVTTQAEGEEESSAFWKISDESLSTLLYATELNRDDTIKFYAVKAIENITALTQIAKLYFTPNDNFLLRFLEIFRFNKNLELRTSAVYTISHLIRLEPKLYKSFLDKLSLPELQKFLQNETPKIQQALLNCVLFAVHSESNKQALLRNENFSTFLAFLIQHLDHSNTIMKMKIVLTFAFILEDTYNIGTFGDKLFSVLQKLRKENSNELHSAVKVFEGIFTNKMKFHVKNFVSIMSKIMKLNTKMANTNYFEEIVELSNALLTVASYSKIMHALYSLEFLDCLLKIIENNENVDEYILKNVYEILRNFSENLSAVNENNEFIIKRMFVPILKSSLSIKFENKILPLNIAANMITLILDDDRLYSSTVLEEGKTKYINTLIIQVLPILKEMLKIEDLVFATLSFLSLIIERNSAFIKFYKTEGIMDYVFELMKDANFYSNLNIIKIFIKLIEYSDTSFSDIISMNLIEKVNFLIANDTGDNSIFTEYVIELFYDLMFKINEQKKQIAVNIDKDEFKKFTHKIESVAKNFKMCIKLLGSDNIVSRKNVFFIFKK